MTDANHAYLIAPAEILEIAGPAEPDHFRRHLLFMRYTLGIDWLTAFHMAAAMRTRPIEANDAEYVAGHWHNEV